MQQFCMVGIGGLEEAINKISLEAKMKFMTPHGPPKTFYWPVLSLIFRKL